MKRLTQPTLILSLSLFLLVSCGKDSGDSSPSQEPTLTIQEQEAEGSYKAIMRPMNNSLSGFLPTGGAEFIVQGDNLEAKTYLDDDAKVKHIQSVHTGTRCPTEADDKNGDGIVDIDEAYQVVGEVLISLDADLNSHEEGFGLFPVGSGFTYVEKASLSKIEGDIQLRVEQNLNLGGRVVLFHGVNGGTVIPETVATRDGMLRQDSVPIVCGIIRRLD